MQKLFLFLIVVLSSVIFSGCSSYLHKSNRAGLQIFTNNIPAAVFLDGQHLDKTPYINKELKPGQYLLKIEPDDSSLVPYETTINLRKGLLTVVTWKAGTKPELSGGVIYELEKLTSSTKTELSIVSIPDGSVISIDDGEKQFSPSLIYDLEAGSHEITVSRPSFETQSHTVNIVEGHRLNVLVKLAKNPSDDGPSSEAKDSQDNNSSASSSAKTTTKTTTDTEKSTDKDSKDLNLNLLDESTLTIKSTNFFQDGTEVLRVRDAAGRSGKELGFAEVGQDYTYLDETSQGWYKIDFEDQEGWVSGQYATLNQ